MCTKSKPLVLLFTTWLFILVACAPMQTQPRQVKFGELVGNPKGCAGEQVCTQGVYLTAFKVDPIGAS